MIRRASGLRYIYKAFPPPRDKIVGMHVVPRPGELIEGNTKRRGDRFVSYIEGVIRVIAIAFPTMREISVIERGRREEETKGENIKIFSQRGSGHGPPVGKLDVNEFGRESQTKTSSKIYVVFIISNILKLQNLQRECEN